MDEAYNKYINFFGLIIEKQPKIYRTKEEPKKGEYIRRNDGYYYTLKEPGILQKKDEYELVDPVHPMILKDIIANIFKKILEKEGYKIDVDRLASYYVRKENDTISHENEDIYKIIKGFEYRVRTHGGLFYLTLDYKINFKPNVSIKNLIEKGIEPDFFINTDTFVNFLKDDRRIKGKIETITSETAKVADSNGDIHEADLNSIYPETKTYLLDRILEKLGKRKNAVYMQRSATFLNIKQASRKRLDEIKNIRQNLSELFPIDYGGFEIKIKENLTPVLDLQSSELQPDIIDTEGTMETKDYLFYGDFMEEEPCLLFDEEDSSKSHSQPYYGLRNFGPYSKRDISNIVLSIICPNDKKDQMQNLFQAIKEGGPRFYEGTKKMFRTELSLNHVITTDNMSIEAYQDACDEFAQKDAGKTDVVLVYIPETPRNWPHSPYYRAKFKLLREGYTSQMITENTFSNLNYSLLNLASAIYAKAGGIPWVLEREIRDVDMVVGMSYSQIAPERAHGLSQPVKRYLGFVNIFDQYGKWLFFQANTTPYLWDQKLETFSKIISEVIKKFENEKGFKPSKLAFHYSKKFGRDEQGAIISAVEKEVDDPKIMFIRIDSNHPFRAFDLSTSDGSLSRRSYIYLGANDYLLSTTGFSDISRQGIGTPKLLHINNYQYPEKFVNSNQVIEQVFSMTRLNWATAMTLVREPVTISFSRLTAYMIASLNASMWNEINVPQLQKRIEGKTWFI